VTEQIKNARMKAWKRQRGQCYYCNGTVAKHKATLDHRIPASNGGNLQDGNAVMACRRCNEEKASMPEHIFLQGPAAREAWRAANRMEQKVSDSAFFEPFRDSP
jgi:5-methylcytosine-specific restriction endonuclease McrA